MAKQRFVLIPLSQGQFAKVSAASMKLQKLTTALRRSTSASSPT